MGYPDWIYLVHGHVSGAIFHPIVMVWGPQYTSENIGWSGSWISGAYNQYATATRPYMFGWVGFGVGWPYADKAEIGLRSSWLKERLTLDFSFIPIATRICW